MPPKKNQQNRPDAQIFTTQLDGQDVASRALNGDPILVYPKGTHHREMWGGKIKTWEVDDEIISDLVENYTHRLERGIRQGLLPVNEDHNGSRALGYFDQVVATPEGLAASFTWNPKGREALENGEFAYFSMEILDRIVDRVTGETVKNQISGGALTNYPFFGEAAALMSRSANPKEASMPTEVQHQDAPQDVAWYRGLVDKLTGQFTTGAPAQNGSPIQDRKGEDLRAEFDRRIQEIETQMESRIADVESERDAYARQIDDLRGQLSQTEDARAREKFSRMAAGYSHVPAKTSDLAEHLRWLHEVDSEGEHAAFFTRMLSRTDEAFASQFRAKQLRHDYSIDNAENRIHTMAKEYSAEHPDVNYTQALGEVLTEHPELAQAYQEEVQNERRS